MLQVVAMHTPASQIYCTTRRPAATAETVGAESTPRPIPLSGDLCRTSHCTFSHIAPIDRRCSAGGDSAPDLLGRSVTRAEPCLHPGSFHPVARSSPTQGDSRVRRLVIGSATFALVAAMAVLAPTGASAAASHSSDRTAPSQGGTAAKPAPPGGIAAAAASANRARQQQAGGAEGQQARRVQGRQGAQLHGLNYVPYERTYRGIPVVGGDFVVSTDNNGKILGDQRRADPPGQAPLGQGHGLPGRGPRHQRAPAEPRHPRQDPPRGAADQALPARVGDLGDRAQARRGLAPDGVRRRAHRSRADHEGARPRGHRQRQLGGQRHHPDDRLRLVVLDDEQQRLHAQVPERERQRHVHRHRRRVGQRQRDGPRDRLRRRVLLGREDAPDDVDVAGPQRHERLGRLGADPGRASTTSTPTTTAPRSRSATPRPAASGSARWTSWRTSSATGSTTRRRAASRAAAPRSSWATPSARRRSASPTTRPTCPTSPSVKRSTWSARARSASCTTRRPVGDPNCYSSSIPNTEVHAAAGPGNHWYYLLSQGSSPTGGTGQPDLQRLVGHGHRHPEGPADHVQRDAAEDVLVVLPEVPDLDADRGQEPVPGQLHRVQHRQGGVGRGVASRRRPPTRPARPLAA